MSRAGLLAGETWSAGHRLETPGLEYHQTLKQTSPRTLKLNDYQGMS